MECPFCGHPESRVMDSRPGPGGIRRRRECLACGRRFSTMERVELENVMVVKKDGRREPFSREKVLAGVRKACEKRPIPTGALEELVERVEREVYALSKAEVPTSYIGDLVMEELRRLDRIAYIRFASVYRAFADVDELERELEALKAGWPRPEVPPGQLVLLPDQLRSRGLTRQKRLEPKVGVRRLGRVRRDVG
ncbi:MAG TPA: transcriptional regulator NrdR [Dehalococcoidia bacterium]|nr:transcriptional regulator NrdR [Dehalococcoidia bacterium]